LTCAASIDDEPRSLDREVTVEVVMGKLPLYHDLASGIRGAAPSWWFGAPFIAVAYAVMTPRVLPDVVAIPADQSGVAGLVRVLVGLVLGVTVLSAWRIVRWALARRRRLLATAFVLVADAAVLVSLHSEGALELVR